MSVCKESLNAVEEFIIFLKWCQPFGDAGKQGLQAVL